MKKNLKSIICGSICIIIVVCSFFIPKTSQEKALTQLGKTHILELWHIDTFEGGKGSRKDFLLSSSLLFEKNNDIIISVISHTIESATITLKDYVPDMISCGNGLDIASLVKSISIKSQNSLCQIDNKNYGASWCRGGYALIGEGEYNTLIVSQSEYTLPLKAYKTSGFNFKEIKVLEPKKAYQEYLLKGGYLLGTQRDIIRLTNRGINVKYQPISSFCDLYQVICITTTNKEKFSYCQDFIAFLLSSNRQKALTNIGMLSILEQEIYNNDILDNLQKTKIEKVQNFFTSPEILKNITNGLKQELKTC